MTTRRKFLTQSVLVSAGMIIGPELLKAVPGNNAAHKTTNTDSRIAGLQLYSLREQLPKDVSGVITKVSKAGYREVETYAFDKKTGFFNLPVKDFRKILDDNGLKAPSGHFSLDTYFSSGATDDLKAFIDAACLMGMQYATVSYINNQFLATADGCRQIAEKMNKAAEICKRSGIKLGYHNHNFEWKDSGGTTFYDTLLKYGESSLVHLEMDIYWVVRAGKDPVKLIRENPGRFFAFHIKDMEKTNHDLNTEVGKGIIDFKPIINNAALAGVKYFIVEQENYINIDPYVSIAESCNYVKNVLNV